MTHISFGLFKSLNYFTYYGISKLHTLVQAYICMTRRERASVAQLDTCPNGDRKSRLRSPPDRQHSFMEIGLHCLPVFILAAQMSKWADIQWFIYLS